MTPPPVLGVSCSISLPAQAPPTAGHIVGQQQLASYLEKALDVGPHNIVLFLQDKVNPHAVVECPWFIYFFLISSEALKLNTSTNAPRLVCSYMAPPRSCAWSCSLFAFIRTLQVLVFFYLIWSRLLKLMADGLTGQQCLKVKTVSHSFSLLSVV